LAQVALALQAVRVDQSLGTGLYPKSLQSFDVMAALNEVHKAQISRFVTFFKGKRERLLSDRESDKEEFKSDRLADEEAIFNKTDVVDLIDTYHALLIGSIREELENMINLSAVYISQVFGQAETQFGALLDGADVCMIEDQNQRQAIADLVTRGAAPAPLTKRNATLPSLEPTGGTVSADIAVAQELQDLKAANQQMNDRYRTMQQETATLLQERSSLAQELEKMKINFATLRAQMHALNPECSNPGVEIGANALEIERQLNESKATLDVKNAELATMSKEMNKRLGDSSQFKELKAIVKKKSDEVKQLRRYVASSGLPLPDIQTAGVDLAPDDD